MLFKRIKESRMFQPKKMTVRENIVLVLCAIQIGALVFFMTGLAKQQEIFAKAMLYTSQARMAELAYKGVSQGPEAIFSFYKVRNADELRALKDDLSKKSSETDASFQAVNNEAGKYWLFMFLGLVFLVNGAIVYLIFGGERRATPRAANTSI